MTNGLFSYTDFAPNEGRFVWEGRPPGEVFLALKENQGQTIITIPHPDTGEEVQAVVLYVEVPEQPPLPLLDDEEENEIVPRSLEILCSKEFDTPDRPVIALEPPHIRLHCNQVFGEEPETWKHPWL
jgi:hypothetical protein